MGTKAVTRSLALLPLQPVKEQFPQRQTLKIARSRLHPCQPHPDEAVCEEPPPLSAHGARPLAQVTQLNGPVPVGPRPWPGGGSAGGPQRCSLASLRGCAGCWAPETLRAHCEWDTPSQEGPVAALLGSRQTQTRGTGRGPWGSKAWYCLETRHAVATGGALEVWQGASTQ